MTAEPGPPGPDREPTGPQPRRSPASGMFGALKAPIKAPTTALILPKRPPSLP